MYAEAQGSLKTSVILDCVVWVTPYGYAILCWVCPTGFPPGYGRRGHSQPTTHDQWGHGVQAWSLTSVATRQHQGSIQREDGEAQGLPQLTSDGLCERGASGPWHTSQKGKRERGVIGYVVCLRCSLFLSSACITINFLCELLLLDFHRF